MRDVAILKLVHPPLLPYINSSSQSTLPSTIPITITQTIPLNTLHYNQYGL
jgi:hypothetical protein